MEQVVARPANLTPPPPPTPRNANKLWQCRDCGQTISKNAFDCPHCGAVLRKRHGVFYYVFVGTLCLILTAFILGGGLLLFTGVAVSTLVGFGNRHKDLDDALRQPLVQTNHGPLAPESTLAETSTTKLLPPLTPTEIAAAQDIIRTLKVTHDDVRDITWYQFDAESKPKVNLYEHPKTMVDLYVGASPNKPPWLMFKLSYLAHDWIFVQDFLVRADGELLTITPAHEITRDMADGRVYEIFNESAESNLSIIFKIISSEKCVLRFNGQHSYVDYEVTSEDKLEMSQMILVFRSLGGNLTK
jgi:hypothetical protein